MTHLGSWYGGSPTVRSGISTGTIPVLVLASWNEPLRNCMYGSAMPASDSRWISLGLTVMDIRSELTAS